MHVDSILLGVVVATTVSFFQLQSQSNAFKATVQAAQASSALVKIGYV